MNVKYLAILVSLLVVTALTGCASDAVVSYTASKTPAMSLAKAKATIKQFRKGYYWPPKAGAFHLPTRFDDAVPDYKAGLEIAPWWPQGHFDAAMVLGELHYYDEAISHMKKYLELVPAASNARAAQDQIYRWESEEQTKPSGQ